MKPLPRHLVSKTGFSLIELLGVVAAIGVLTSIGYVTVTNTKKSASATKLEQDVASINRSIQLYLANGGNLTGVTTTDALLTKLKTKGQSSRVLGITSSVLDSRVVADYGDSSSRLRARWMPSPDNRFVLETSTSGVVEFRLDDSLSSTAAATETDRSTSKDLATSGGWVWDKGTAVEVASSEGSTPGAAVAVNPSLAALLSHPNLTGGVSIVGSSGAVTTDNKYYDGAGYMGELGIFSLDGMGDPPYNLKTREGLLAFMREAVRRVAEGGAEGGIAMSRDGTGHTVNFNPGTAVAFILIPDNTFDNAYSFLEPMTQWPTGTPNDTRYPLTSLSFDTGNVTGFSQSQAVSMGRDAYAIEDISGGGDQDYEDIVWKTTGITQPDWSTMRTIDPATYYPSTKLDQSSDTLINGTRPTLRQALQGLGLIP